MKWRVLLMVFGAALSGGGCTGSNPRSCKDGSCTDPAFPFCDVSGAIAGNPETCIAPICTPGDFAECRGATAVTCNGTGNDYDLVQCPRGCDEASGGCVTVSCTPGAFSECQGDSQVVCNSAGNDYGVIACEHGCDPATGCLGISCTPNEFSRCQGDDAVTCNGSGNNYTLVHCDHGCDPASGCLACQPNTTTCTNGTLTTCDATGHNATPRTCDLGCAPSEPRCRVVVPSNNLKQYLDLVVDPPNLVLVSPVFDTDSGTVTQGGQTVAIPTALVPATAAGPAIRVFLFDTLDMSNAHVVSTPSGGGAGAAVALVGRGAITIRGQMSIDPVVGGSFPIQSCEGVPDNGVGIGVDGSGGGANASPGGRGGSAGGSVSPGGLATGTPNLVPLRGGCRGGSRLGRLNGGGAAQISTSGTVQILGSVSVRGAVGDGDMTSVDGGGAGGGLLIEGAKVTVSTTSVLDARGGDGRTACPILGICGVGGAGATSTSAAGDGEDVPGMAGSYGGGGGGGLGRVRVNTLDGTFNPVAGSVIQAATTTGMIVVM